MTTFADLPAGTVFAGDYRIVAPLRAGGMGAVYVVVQVSTGIERALKVMHPELASVESLRRRFEQEARVSSRIQSEHVVQVLAEGVDAQTGMPWLVMELLRGEDLRTLVARAGRLALPVVQRIFDQVCHAMAASHRAGIVHRDLKPENIFVADGPRGGDDFVVKVLDFGIAMVTAEARLTTAGNLGSPVWIAPEQTETSGHITPATDVWALGLIAFLLLTGRSFWKAADRERPAMTALMREIVIERVPSASERAREVGASLPAGFDAWLARCLARDPAARFPTAAELNEALQRLG